ncbi:MAG: globin [Leptospirillia bacterium]
MASLSEVTDSFKRCLSAPEFLDCFFEKLLQVIPEVAPLFVDMSELHRNAIVRKGVTTIFMNEAGSPKAADDLARLRRLHGPERMNIRPEMFSAFQRVFLDVVREYDAEHTPELEQAWKEIMERGISRIATR